MQIKARWRSLRDWSSRAWTNIRPGPEARKGAIWGAVLVALWIAIVGGIYLKSGFGLTVDLAFALIVALLGVPLVALLVVLLLKILRKLPVFATAVIFGVLALVMLSWSP